MIIAVDFDGTCVTHEFPKVGKDRWCIIQTLCRLEQNESFIKD
jgi:hypothetical protein